MLRTDGTSGKERLERPVRYAISHRRLFPGLSAEVYLARLFETSASVVQLRESDLEPSALHSLAKLGRHLSEAHRKPFLLNTDLDLAIEAAADGVHLKGIDDPGATRKAAQKAGRPDLLIGWSVHSIEEVRQASELPVDYVLLSPIFPTLSKVGGPPLGLDALREACSIGPLPVIALGGITPERVDAVLSAGAAGFAGISWAADEIRAREG